MANIFFYDTEFLEGKQKESFPMSLFRKETKPTIDLISIGIVSEDGREYYAISKDFNLKEAWNRNDLVTDILHGGMMNDYWIRDNVLSKIYNELANFHINGYMKEHFGYPIQDSRILTFSYGNLKWLISKYGKTNKEIAVEVKEFTGVIARDKFDNSFVTGDKVELYGYYSAYDHTVLCWLFGKMIDRPHGFPMFTRDLKQEFDVKQKYIDYIVKNDYQLSVLNKAGKTYNSLKEYPGYPKETNAHNALADAKWNKELYNFLKTV
jgi:3' exoribonuclease, RNase T-like